MTRVWLNAERIRSAFIQAAEEALDEFGDRVAADARQRAPVRKVFREKKGYKRRFRRLTPSEQSIAIQRANNYYGSVRPDEFARRRAVSYIRNYGRVELRRPGSMNSLARSREMRFLGVERAGRFTARSGAIPLRGGGFEPGPDARKAMTSRGRYEVRSGRAVHRQTAASGTTKVQVGGALKASISSSGVVESGKTLLVRIGAYIRYAKYVEFPTIRTAAQPFLLPALHGQRETLPRLFASALRRTLGGR